MAVIVVGGGIGGLFAANALHQRGIDVAVYEQAATLSEVGAGVQLTPNSVRQLQRLGLGDAVDRAGAVDSERSQYFRHDGSPIAPITTTDSRGWNAVMGMHRADLIEMLAANLPGGVVQTGRRCVGFEQDERAARVTFADGTTSEADVVIAADGLHSRLQHHVVKPSIPLYSGSVAYRGLVSRRRIAWWPPDEIQLWMGPSRHFLTYPVRAGEMINWVAFIPADESLAESWSAPGDPAVLRREFAGWDERVAQLIAHLEVVYGWGLYDREPLARWTNGRLTLLGDAAHPMLPHVGQGANQAMEDGMALATVLSAAPGRSPAALAAYERMRRERTSEVQRRARQTGRAYDSNYDDLAARDADIAASRDFRFWVYDYDVLHDAEQVAAAL
ncbi:MAG TPA: FAD-dependent monooxygenase [Solirubrobacteraceae bacterium]|jgi:salicylate hydroxylase|nr:FAD-dependent monooxygenase [Solirubrobacteraceae bacterium]